MSGSLLHGMILSSVLQKTHYVKKADKRAAVAECGLIAPKISGLIPAPAIICEPVVFFPTSS